MNQVGAKMALRWPTWSQDGAKMANMTRKMANLASSWGVSWRLFDENGEKAKNIKKPMVF